MRLILAIAILSAWCTSCSHTPTSASISPESIIAQERAALDRWGKGDPGGYLSIYDTEVTYFDPLRDTRADGLASMQAYLAPITGKVKVDRYDMISPKVQIRGDVAVLSYQLASYGVSASGKSYVVRWNSSKIYARSGSDWKILHDHWSFIKPELKEPSPE